MENPFVESISPDRYYFQMLLYKMNGVKSVLYILQKSPKLIIISKKLFNYNTENYVMSVETGLLILLNQYEFY
jgi:hypothetical protein